MLPMHCDGPIAVSAVAAYGFALAHYYSGRCYQCLRVGPLLFRQPLPTASLWPIIFPVDVTDALGWARCICTSCYQWFRLGHLLSQEVLLMPLYGPITLE